ncbi:MAG: hypothetical protein AAB927_03095 [Patescibacteria group bacterium]
MKMRKGVSKQGTGKPHFDKKSERRKTPPRVAPRQQPVVKNARIRSKKHTLTGRK